MSLVWTKEPPQVGGYYWMVTAYPNCRPTVAFCEYGGPNGVPQHFTLTGVPDRCPIEWGHKWAGPIPEPTEPGDGEK